MRKQAIKNFLSPNNKHKQSRENTTQAFFKKKKIEISQRKFLLQSSEEKLRGPKYAHNMA